jgi:hypothetical protein
MTTELVEINFDPLKLPDDKVTLYALDANNPNVHDAVVATWLRMVYQDSVEFHFLNIGLLCRGPRPGAIIYREPRGVFTGTRLDEFWTTMSGAMIGNLFQIEEKTPEFNRIRRFTLSWWSDHGSIPPCAVESFSNCAREQDPDKSKSKFWDILLLSAQQWTESLLSDAHRRGNKENSGTLYAQRVREAPVYT